MYMFHTSFFFFLNRAGHSHYLPGGSRPQYGRHIYVRPSQGSNPGPPDQTAEAQTTELSRRTSENVIFTVVEYCIGVSILRIKLTNISLIV